MLNISEMSDELKKYTALQNTVMPMLDTDYIKIIVWAIKKYFVDINHPEQYDPTLYITDEDDTLFYNMDFDVLREDYIFILCKIRFKRFVMSDFTGDGAVSYTTDALSVTGAKEGYKSIQLEIDDLERERIRVFHKIMAHEDV